MRKKVFGRQLSRSRKGRRALIRSLIKALIVNGKITTTKAKVKFVQGQVDKLVTLTKKENLSARRKALAFLGNDRKTNDLFFSKVVPVFKDRKSGFTKLTLLPRRKGDNAEMAILEWVEKYIEPKEKVEVKKEKKNVKKTDKEIKKTKKRTLKKEKSISKKK